MRKHGMRSSPVVSLAVVLFLSVLPGKALRAMDVPGQPEARRVPAVATIVEDYAQLKDRAAAGDAAAALKLSADFRRCEYVEDMRERLGFWRDYRISQGDRADAVGAAFPPSVSSEDKEAIVTNDHGLCTGYSGDMRDGRVYEVLLQAANLGDWDAAECYLSTSYPMQRGRYSAIDFTTYRSHARRLLDEAIQQGQWGIVRTALMAMTVKWIDNPPMSAGLGGDIDTTYRLAALLLLGAPKGSPEARFLERQAAIDAAQMTPAQLGEGNQWAQRMFANFRASGPSTPFTSACEHEPMHLEAKP